MTLSRQYEQLMSHIHVTPEMADRILKNLEGTRRKSHAPVYWAAGIVAASLVLVVSTAIFHFAPGPQTQVAPVLPEIQITNEIVKAESPEALAQLVGFPLPSIPELPFEPQAIVYSSYWNKMAQITCSGAENTAVLRMTPGTEDCSGDYTDYKAEQTLKLNDFSIVLKGQDGTSFQLAVWSDGEYSYSIKMDQGISAEQWKEIILSFPNV